VSAGPRLARRTALTLGAGVIVLTGCDDGDTPSGATADRSTDPDVDSDVDSDVDPDVALVGSVVYEVTRVRAIATTAGAADLVALHDAHLEALDGATGPAGASPSPPSSPPASTAPGRARDLWRHERALQARLVEAAVAARSGALAALLASMSAAQSQVLAQATVSR
jgi:hypothetical protein